MDNINENNDEDKIDYKALINTWSRLYHLIIIFGIILIIGIVASLISISNGKKTTDTVYDQILSSVQETISNNQISVDYNQISQIISDEIASQISIIANLSENKSSVLFQEPLLESNAEALNIPQEQILEISNQIAEKIISEINNLDYISDSDFTAQIDRVIQEIDKTEPSITKGDISQIATTVIKAEIPSIVANSIADYVTASDNQVTDNANAAYELAESTPDVTLANLYYLNAINSAPDNIKILSSYKDFLINNQFDDLIAPFMEILYNICQIADYSLLPEIYSINDELVEYYNETLFSPAYEEGPVLSDINDACDEFDALLIADSSFSELTSSYLEILDLQDNCIDPIDTDTENRLILVDQFYSFASAYNTAGNVYRELSGLTGETYINQYPVLISSLQSCYDVFDVDASIYSVAAQEIISAKCESIASFLVDAEEKYHQEFREIINSVVGVAISESRTMKTNKDKIEVLTNASYSCSVLLSSALNTSDFDAISSGVQKLNDEIQEINKKRLVDYQIWAYEAMEKAENAVNDFERKDTTEFKISSIQKSEFVSVDRNLLSYQLQSVYDEILSLIADKVLDDEEAEKAYYSMLSETQIKQLEDF